MKAAGITRYSTGEAANLAGLSSSVIRWLEREDLMRPERTAGGHRLYSADDIKRLRRIRILRTVEGINGAAIKREIGAARSSDGAAAAANVIDPALGPRCRQLREAQALSLADVARRSGFSVSFLSAAERGLVRISLGKLFKLADALGTTVPGLTGTHQSGSPVVAHLTRPHQRVSYRANFGRVLIQDLISEAGAMEAQWFEIKPGGESEETYAHPGEEMVLLLSGVLSFRVGEDAPYRLRRGDALHFPSSLPHRWSNEGKDHVLAVWINVPLGERAERARHHHRSKTDDASRAVRPRKAKL